jgi:hypothetical protein
LAFDPSTPPAELRAVVFEHGLPIRTKEHDPIITISVRVNVRHVLDLTDPDTRGILDLSESELYADWEHQQDEYIAGRRTMPATQLLALAAHLSDLIIAIQYPSARTKFGVNLVVFPDRLNAAAGDFLEAVDSTGRYAQHLP